MLLALRRIAALASVIAAALVVPALASAADFKVTGTGDSGETPAQEACKTGVGECTLRAAIADANAASDLDKITFGSTFNGGSGSTISLGSTLSISQPVEILDSVIDEPSGSISATTLHSSAGAISISSTATGTVVEGLGIEAHSIGIQILGEAGAKIRGNFISGAQAAIEVNPSGTNTGSNLIEGNVIHVPAEFKFGIVTQVGGNRIFGNEIEGSGCCYTGIWLEGSSSGNQIGGDTAESENVINGFGNGSIWIAAAGNEVGRNRGSGGGEFLHTTGSTPAPTIATAQQPKVTGTAKAGATVRVFKTQSESLNEIEGFVGEATAGLDGKWEASLAGIPAGTLVTATATLDGETSGLSATTAVTPEPEKEKETGGGEPGGGGSGSGGGSNGGGTPSGGSSNGGSSTGSPTTVTSSPPPASVAPKATITKGPAKSSESTTARFTFRATPATGVKFQCKLDGAKWASCKSPKVYKKLKPGKHTFQVRATASGLIGPAAKFKFTVKR
ncbi:MAG TPA: hypothetical protein VGC32_10295 [Solirubrobacterales bacterium]